MQNGFFRTFFFSVKRKKVREKEKHTFYHIGYKRSKHTPKHKDGDRLHEPIPILFLSFSFWGAFFSFV